MCVSMCVGVMDILVKDGNWDTPTRHEDALIMNTFYYKVYSTQHYIHMYVTQYQNMISDVFKVLNAE